MSVFSYSNKKTARYFLAIRPSYYIAHNPEVVRFKSHSRNQRSPTKTSVWLGFFLVLPPCDLMFFRAFSFVFLRFCLWHFGRQICVTGSALLSWRPSPCVAKGPNKMITLTNYSINIVFPKLVVIGNQRFFQSNAKPSFYKLFAIQTQCEVGKLWITWSFNIKQFLELFEYCTLFADVKYWYANKQQNQNIDILFNI